jgi:hypothetical protein
MTLCDFCAILSGNEPRVSGTGGAKEGASSLLQLSLN